MYNKIEKHMIKKNLELNNIIYDNDGFKGFINVSNSGLCDIYYDLVSCEISIEENPKNVCIDDLRYPNEYKVLKDYCNKNEIDFKLVFCDYHSDVYEENNQHESTQLARYLKKLGYQDQDYVDELDILNFELLYKDEK